jgi:hypothetical protein
MKFRPRNFIDLLFFNWIQARFVVVELKVGRFEPEYVGKLGFYVSWIDDNLRDYNKHAPTIGIPAVRRTK